MPAAMKKPKRAKLDMFPNSSFFFSQKMMRCGQQVVVSDADLELDWQTKGGEKLAVCWI